MASPVDTSVKHFTSTMLNAPVLNGVVGSLISVLDAVLVNGFDSKTATSLVVAGGVATLSFGGTHSAVVDSVILVAGSSIAALNGEQKVTVSAPGQVKFATAAADGTATGTITFKIAPLGWSKVFSGTNKAVYKSTDPMSNGHYLRVDDTSARVARVVGYETMSDADTGVAPFPTAIQIPGGAYWGKSMAANTTRVMWAVIGDSRTFYIHMAAYQGNGTPVFDTNTAGAVWGFGDMVPYRVSGDSYLTVLAGGDSGWESGPQNRALDNSGGSVFAPRSHTGLGSATPLTSFCFTGSSASISGTDTTLGTFPGAIDGALRLSRRFVRPSTPNDPRGEVPGLFTVPQGNVGLLFNHFDKVDGGAELIGRRLMGLSVANSYSNSAPSTTMGMTFFDITGPWR